MKIRVIRVFIVILLVCVLLQLMNYILVMKAEDSDGELGFNGKNAKGRSSSIMPEDSPSRNLADILDQVGNKKRWGWISDRMRHTWPHLEQAIKRLSTTRNVTNQTTKRILVLPGVLTRTDFASVDTIEHGGPLGDLLQWADLIAGLHILGHKVILRQNLDGASQELRLAMDLIDTISQSGHGCASSRLDLIYTDIVGYRELPESLTQAYRSKFRIVDAFGTEAIFNDKVYAMEHGLSTTFSGLGLNLKQFYTFYPHTPDNSFLGFIIPLPPQSSVEKKTIAVLYGKESRYLKGHENVIRVISRYAEVHSTIKNEVEGLPDNLINHGIMPHQQYQHLLMSAKVFVGLGAPIDANGALEAVARGSVFINPKFSTPQFRGKPTSRQPTSQISYLEEWVGPPRVLTVNYDNLTAVETAMQQAISTELTPWLPYEFTADGFLERLSAYIAHQDYCGHTVTGSTVLWPPESELHTLLSPPDMSCNTVCRREGLICESVFFQLLNSTDVFKIHGVRCSSTITEANPLAPCITTRANRSMSSSLRPDHQRYPAPCSLQSRETLYSCAGHATHVQRLCPCRTYITHQMALCRSCV